MAQLSGMDLSGSEFAETAHTILVSPSGAILECSRALGPDQEVAVRVGKREALARVLGQAGLSETKYIYGVSFIQPDAAFWGVHFPKIEEENRPAATLIECCRCGIQRTYILNEIESLVLSSSRTFGLSCSTCKDGTLWKVSSGAISVLAAELPAKFLRETDNRLFTEPSPEPTPAMELIPMSEPITNETPKAKRGNERKYRRVSMSKAKAAIKRANSAEETVDLVNVSRGGAGFRSDKVYPLGCWIRIAAPCTVGASNIFVLGRVVRAVKAETGREYGVEYVQSEG